VLSLPVPSADITKPTSVVFRGSQEKKERDRLRVRKKHNEEHKDKWNMKRRKVTNVEENKIKIYQKRRTGIQPHTHARAYTFFF